MLATALVASVVAIANAEHIIYVVYVVYDVDHFIVFKKTRPTAQMYSEHCLEVLLRPAGHVKRHLRAIAPMAKIHAKRLTVGEA